MGRNQKNGVYRCDWKQIFEMIETANMVETSLFFFGSPLWERIFTAVLFFGWHLLSILRHMMDMVVNLLANDESQASQQNQPIETPKSKGTGLNSKSTFQVGKPWS